VARLSWPATDDAEQAKEAKARAFASAWSDAKIVQRVVARLPWRQNVETLPDSLRGSLPTVEEIEAELATEPEQKPRAAPRRRRP
jgi:hypothetical protein